MRVGNRLPTVENIEVKALIINGVAESGKDSFMDALEESGEYNVIRVSIVDAVKEIASIFGYDMKVKTKKDRQMLSDLFTVMDKYNGSPFTLCMDRINALVADKLLNAYTGMCYVEKALEGTAKPELPPVLICVVAREPIHIAQFVDTFTAADIPVRTVIIRREVVEADGLVPDNKADLGVFRFPYDMHIWNNGTKEEFKEHILCGVKKYQV